MPMREILIGRLPISTLPRYQLYARPHQLDRVAATDRCTDLLVLLMVVDKWCEILTAATIGCLEKVTLGCTGEHNQSQYRIYTNIQTVAELIDQLLPLIIGHFASASSRYAYRPSSSSSCCCCYSLSGCIPLWPTGLISITRAFGLRGVARALQVFKQKLKLCVVCYTTSPDNNQSVQTIRKHATCMATVWARLSTLGNTIRGVCNQLKIAAAAATTTTTTTTTASSTNSASSLKSSKQRDAAVC
jgi:hypothetical protein